ncbi:DUF1153 domain-containing protein [Paludibacterium sp. B53371]|uniref:DUF1153 domain-containing protein n=1 Tax=Paludibacterium sp. B53371 TaxID=2806263 RepID=UPI00207B617D|nr:DUF1153 domain-containing protein [Paludibacterium sp. B53371]
MSMTMEDEIKRWTAKRKAALVMEIIQGKTTATEASRSFDLTPSEVEEWVDEAKRGMENALRARPMETREQNEKQIKDLQKAYGEAMLAPLARKIVQSVYGEDDKSSRLFRRDWQKTVSRYRSANCAAGLMCRDARCITVCRGLRPSSSSTWWHRSSR